MAADNNLGILRSREVSTMIRQGFIPDQALCFSPSRSTSARSSHLYSPSSSPPNSSPVTTAHQSLTRPTLFEMMSQEQQNQDSTAQLRSKVSKILSNAPFNNSIASGGRWGTNNRSGDVRLTIVSTDGFRISMDVHRQVLSEKSRYFAERLRLEKGSHSVEVEISECDDVEVYVETVVLMYTDDLKRKLAGEDVTKVLGLLKVNS